MGWECCLFDKVTFRGPNEVREGSRADSKVQMAYES